MARSRGRADGMLRSPSVGPVLRGSKEAQHERETTGAIGRAARVRMRDAKTIELSVSALPNFRTRHPRLGDCAMAEGRPSSPGIARAEPSLLGPRCRRRWRGRSPSWLLFSLGSPGARLAWTRFRDRHRTESSTFIVQRHRSFRRPSCLPHRAISCQWASPKRCLTQVRTSAVLTSTLAETHRVLKPTSTGVGALGLARPRGSSGWA